MGTQAGHGYEHDAMKDKRGLYVVHICSKMANGHFNARQTDIERSFQQFTEWNSPTLKIVTNIVFTKNIILIRNLGFKKGRLGS